MAKGDTIQLYHATVAGVPPPAGSLVQGELALDSLASPPHLYTLGSSGVIDLLTEGLSGDISIGGDLAVGGDTTITGMLRGANPWIPFGYSFDPAAPALNQWKATDANAVAVYASSSSQGLYPTLATYLDFFADGGLTVGDTVQPTLIMRLTYEAWREVYWAQFYQPLTAVAVNATTLVSNTRFYGLGEGNTRLVQVGSYNADVPGVWNGNYDPITTEKLFDASGSAGIGMFTDAGYIGNGPRGDGTVNPPNGELGWSWSSINVGNQKAFIQSDYRANGAGQNSGANPNVAEVQRIWIGYSAEQLYPGVTPPSSYPAPSIFLPSIVMDAITNTVVLNSHGVRLAGNYNNTAPTNPVEGTLWADTALHRLVYFNGSTWVQIA